MEAPTCSAVLVVEDDEEIRDLLVGLLRSEGFQVYEAKSAAEALALLPSMPEPVLVLADLMMPTMSGPSFIASLRNGDRFATLPMVAMVAMVADVAASSEDVSDTEAPRPVKKPIDPRDLLQIVSELCLRRT
jgi:two-component system OmpR family response regulator